MSSITGSINLAAATPSSVSPDKIDTYKAALLKKLDEIQEKAEKRVEERFSDIIERAAAPNTDPNQIRYEVKTIAIDLLNLFRGKEKAKDYKFEPKEDVVWIHLIQNIKKLESLILQAADSRFQKFKQEIQGCKNLADVKKTIQNAKRFANDFVEIMKRERKLPGVEIPPPITLEVTPIVTEAPAQTSYQKYCGSLREEMREVIASDAVSNKEDKKTADSRIMAMNGLINFALDNPELFQDYFKPEHRKAVTDAILVILKDKNLSPSLASKDSAELMTFYSKIYTKIKEVMEAKIKHEGVGRSGPMLYRRVATWIGSGSFVSTQMLFIKKLPARDQRIKAEKSFAYIFDAFNDPPYKKECKRKCRRKIISDILYLAKKFASEPPERLFHIGLAFRAHLDKGQRKEFIEAVKNNRLDKVLD